MKIFLVGGAVRDSILGDTPKDRDYVVIGATEEAMLNLGYKKVGAAFPVFRHPETQEEYALARQERKTPGLIEFSFNTNGVSLEDDLIRRDLTINAIAMDDNGTYIDPYNGIGDLNNKILRHVSEAFTEDPLRIFRVARFAARFGDFTIAPETLELMKRLVQTSEFKELSPERVFTELRTVLKYEKPSIFFNVLRDIGGLEFYFPEIHNLIGVPQRPEYHPEGDCYIHTMLVLDHAAKNNKDLRIVYSALVHDLGKGVTPKEKLPGHPGHEESGIPLVQEFGRRLQAPNDWTDAAIIVTRNHLRVHQIEKAGASSIVRMFYEMDAFRKPHLVEILARACEADDLGKNRENVMQGLTLEKYFNVVKDVSFKDIRQDLKGEAISNEIRATRVRVLKESR